MSKQTRLIVGVGIATLILAVAGVAFLIHLQSRPVMVNGPGMLYFYSPT